MLKSFMGVLLLLVVAIPFSTAVAQEEAEAAKIRSLETKLADAYRMRQVDAFASMLDDDFVITFEDGTVYGKTGYLSFSASPGTRVDVSEMPEMKIRLHGHTAIVTGAYHERGETNGQPFDYHDRFTDVWMKEDGKWRLVASHYGIPLKR